MLKAKYDLMSFWNRWNPFQTEENFALNSKLYSLASNGHSE